MEIDVQTDVQAGTCGLTRVVFHGSELSWPTPAGSLGKVVMLFYDFVPS